MAETMHTLTFSDSDYAKAAKDWKKPLLMMPLLQAQGILKYMTGWGNVRYKVALPTVEGSGEFGPYDAFRKTVNDTKVDFRELETFLGSFQEDFEPNRFVSMLIGQSAAILGDRQKEAPSAKLVIACVLKSLGYKLRKALFYGVRNASGNTTMDLFDGWLTIIDKDITAGKISEANGNLITLSGTPTAANAVDLGKEIERSCDPILRDTEKILYCSPEFADLYNDCYQLTHASLSYNKQYEQPYLEGSGNRTTIVPIPELSGSSKYILTPKTNMLYGYDTMGDLTKLEVNRFSTWVLTMAAAMFFGVQIYTIDKRFFKVVDLGSTGGGGDESGEPEEKDPENP